MSVFWGWIHRDPDILYHTPLSEKLEASLPANRLYRLVKSPWYASADTVACKYEEMRRRRPQDVIIPAINESAVATSLRAAGIPALYIPHNSFLDETVLRPEINAVIEYDAIYNARFARFKRHLLASEIRRLLIIGTHVTDDDEAAYEAELRRKLPHATFSGDILGTWLPMEAVAKATSRANVGLCLSGVEGAMYAAVEYLLCDRPVVTTTNQGGRNDWFHGDYVLTVPPDAASIARAVAEFVKNPPPAGMIRSRTISLMAAHRRRFGEWGQSIFDREGVHRDFLREVYHRFQHKLGNWTDSTSFQQGITGRHGRFVP